MAHHLLSKRRKTSILHEIYVLQSAFLVGVGPLVGTICNRLVPFERSTALSIFALNGLFFLFYRVRLSGVSMSPPAVD